jgi:hypothetical protein
MILTDLRPAATAVTATEHLTPAQRHLARETKIVSTIAIAIAVAVAVVMDDTETPTLAPALQARVIIVTITEDIMVAKTASAGNLIITIAPNLL